MVKGNNLRLRRSVMLAALCVLAVAGHLSAQEARISAAVDTTSVRIGEWIRLRVTVESKSDVTIRDIAPADSLSGLEIVAKDSVIRHESDGGVHEELGYSLAAFDSGTFVIPPFMMFYSTGSDTGIQVTESNPIAVFVHGVEVDTSAEIRDIKPPMDVPLSFAELLPYLIGIIAAAGLIYLGYYLLKKRRRGEPILPVAPPRPADEIALEALKALASEKLWERGKVKEYHTRLSDILRVYLENAFFLPAMEMTSDEILESRPVAGLPGGSRELLKTVLVRSDLVKFAKYLSDPQENEESIRTAFRFVELTRSPEEVPAL